MKNYKAGFIPLVAIIILSVLVVAGVIVAGVKISQNNNSEEVLTEKVPEAELSNEEEVQPTIAAEKTEVKITSFTLDVETQDICAQVQTKEMPSEKSLIGDLNILCSKLINKEYEDEAGFVSITESIKDRWELLGITEKFKR